MKKNVFISISSILIIWGIIGMALNRIFYVHGEATIITYLEPIEMNGLTLWKMDIWSYIENIRANITDVASLELKAPTRQFNVDIVNNLKVIVDYLIFIINIIIYPIRLGGYMMRFGFTIIGYNFTTPPPQIKWLVDLINGIVTAQIPYIT